MASKIDLKPLNAAAAVSSAVASPIVLSLTLHGVMFNVFFFSLAVSHYGRDGWLICLLWFACACYLFVYRFAHIMPFSLSAKGWSVVCDCDIPWSYLLVYCFTFCIAVNFILLDPEIRERILPMTMWVTKDKYVPFFRGIYFCQGFDLFGK